MRMRVQYGGSSIRAAGRRGGRGAVWQQNVFAGGAKSGLATVIEENIRFLLHPVVSRKLIRVGLIVVCAALVCNLVCSLLIDSAERSVISLNEQRSALETENITLLAKRGMAWGPGNLEKLVGKKLDLAPAAKGQVAVFDRKRGLFRY